MTAPRPQNITIDRPNNLLIIDWFDGVHCEYPLPGVRYVCPCASCKGGHEYMGLPVDPADIFKTPALGVSTQVVNAGFVGDYGIQFTWGDGHDDGLYSWEYLRPFCPQNPHPTVIEE